MTSAGCRRDIRMGSCHDRGITKGIINVKTFVNGLIAHDDRLYTAILGFNQTNVYVYELSGEKFRSWKHSDEGLLNQTDFTYKALTIIGDQLVIADTKKLTTYSLTGKLLKVVECEKITASYVSLCHAGGDSILVTNLDASPALFKFNLATAAVEWTSNAIKQPSAVTMLNKEYALVTESQSSHHVKLYIINQITGEMRRFPILHI